MTTSSRFHYTAVAFLCLLPNFASAQWSTTTIAGTGTAGFTGDGGMAVDAEINNPFGVIRGPDDAIWFCEYSGERIRRIDSDGTIQTIVGNGQAGYSGDGGPATEATLNQPHEIRFDPAGNLYIVDMQNHAIRMVDLKTNVIETICGNGKPGNSGDGGPAISAQLNKPHSIQFSPEGELYICDIGNHVVRKIDNKTGIITTFAGTGRPGKTPDQSPLAGTPLNGPRSLDFDRKGNLWLATREGNQVFRIDPKAGIISHVAGAGAKGFTGNGGPAKLATLNGPKGLAVDAAGNVWLVDTENHSIRMISAETGNLDLIAGNGSPGDGPDGRAEDCQLSRPHGVFVDQENAVLIGDSESHRVRVLRH
jgi:streptogramin lyase